MDDGRRIEATLLEVDDHPTLHFAHQALHTILEDAVVPHTVRSPCNTEGV